jgi:hypothetical protein
MAQNIILKRSAVPGRVPDTGSINLGEVAINTFDGKLYFKKSGSVESVETIVTTDSITSGSLFVSDDITIQRDLYVVRDVITDGDIDASGSLSGSGLSINDTLNITHNNFQLSGSAAITGSLTVMGEINARQFNINIISSSVIFESGSSKFGNTSDDTHQFTGSVQVTGSLYLNGVDLSQGNNSGSFSGSFQGDGSGLRGVVSDDIPRDGWDYDSNSSASISEFNVTSSKYLIDFQWESEVGTPIGFKTFISNTTGSSQIVPTTEGIKFIVGNQLVATVGAEGINATLPNGVVSSSAQLTSSYDTRYVLSGSITQTTWDNIASKPSGIVSGSTQIIANLPTGTISGSTQIIANLPTGTISGSSQISNLGYAITGSNTFVGTQTMSGSIIPATDNTYDLGSATYQWRDIYVSSGSLYIDGTKVLGSTGNELQITTDVGQSIKILEAGSDSIILQSADGDIQLKSSGGGNLLFDPTSGLIDVRGTLQIQNGNKITSSDGNEIQFGNNIAITGSIVSTTTPLVSGSSQIDLTQTTGYSTFSSSVNSRVVNFENNSGTYATTGSNTFIGTQTITGSLFISSNLVVQGSSSLQNITASAVSIGTNIVNLNTATPAIRYAGLVIGDSGSVGGSGSFLYDSVQDEMLFIHRGDSSVVTSSVALMGPETYDNLGNETYLTNNRLPKGTGKEHLVDSNISDDGTKVTITNGLDVTGALSASTITGFGNVTTHSSSVDSRIITNLNSAAGAFASASSYSGSLATSISASNYNITINSASVSSLSSSFGSRISTIEGKTLVSGSSQIDVMSTTNIARLATTGSNTFIGNQTITGNISLGATNTSYVGPSQYGGVMFPRGGILFSNTNGQNQMYMVSNAYLNVGGTWSYRTASQYAGYMAIDNGAFSVSLAGNSGAADSAVTWTTPISITNAGVTTFGGNVTPDGNGTRDLGSSSARWSTVYTSDLSLNNGIGDWTIVEGEDDLFLYNNKKGKVYKFALTEVDPNVATPKKS